MDKKKLRKTISTVVLMVLGGGVGFLAAKFGMEAAHMASASQVIVFIIFILPIFFLVIGIHEAGHALAGSLVNFEFRMYMVGPFMWDKEERGWKFKWNKNLNVSGGMVICLPSTTENLPKRYSIYALVGPAASLMFAAIAFGAKMTIATINVHNSLWLDVIIMLFTLMSFLSLLIFILTIIPLHTGGFYTDGARAWHFLRGGDTARFETLLMKTISSAAGGIRPRLLNKEEINEALILANKLDSHMKVYVLYYVYHFAFDEGRYDEAEVYLKNYLAELESIPKGVRGSVFLDAAFFYAYARKDLAQAELYWKQYEPSAIIPKAQVLLTEAAIQGLYNDTASVLSTVDKAIKEIPNMMDRGAGIAWHEKLVELKNWHHSLQIR